MEGAPKGRSTAIRQAISPRRLFDPIAGSYEFWAQTLGLLQYRRWRSVLVSQLSAEPRARVLDVCTGTAGVAMEMARAGDRRVVGLDLSREMLLAGSEAVRRRGLAATVQLAQGRAEALPFPEASFDAVVFTFLLRYVHDPEATLGELARVLKPGGRLLSLHFSVPDSPAIRILWLLYTRVVLPAATLPLSAGWRRVGRFLGPSISGFYSRHTLGDIVESWRRAGMESVALRRLSLGGAVVMCGTKGR